MKLLLKTLTSSAVATIAAFCIFDGSATAFSLTNSKNPVKIMPLGDSNTRGKDSKMTGYRDDLWNMFKDEGYNVNFVGSLENGPSSFDNDHEGHGGYTIKGSGGSGELLPKVTGWLKKAVPDVVLLMAGTNDFLKQKNTTAEQTKKELGELIDKIFSWSSDVELFVASLPPINSTNRPEAANKNKEFNDLIPKLLAESRYKDKKLHFVDTRKKLTTKDLSDNVHLTSKGYNKLAQAWFDEIVSAASPNTPSNSMVADEESLDLVIPKNAMVADEPDFDFSATSVAQFDLTEVKTSVPEPNSALGILVVGAFGAWVLQRKKQQDLSSFTVK